MASDSAKFCAARLTGDTGPSFADDEATLDDLQERIAKTRAYLESIPASRFDEAANRDVPTKLWNRQATLSGQQYLLTFALPNFFFHVTTAYAILRHEGLDIGKADFLGVTG